MPLGNLKTHSEYLIYRSKKRKNVSYYLLTRMLEVLFAFKETLAEA